MKPNSHDIFLSAVAAVSACVLLAGLATNQFNWQVAVYDLAMGAIVSVFFYWLLVRLPERAKQTRLKRFILRRHAEMKRECIIELLFAAGHRSVETKFWYGLLDPVAFRDYFYRDNRRRWYAAMNAVDHADPIRFESILRAVESFRNDLSQIIDQTNADRETFEHLKDALNELTAMLHTQRQTDDIKSFFGTLQKILGGWTGNGTVDYDPFEKLLRKLPGKVPQQRISSGAEY